MRALGDRIMVVAFEGWNDAAEAATSALEFLRAGDDFVDVLAVDPEEFFDYQYTRPVVTFDEEGARVLQWPSAVLRRSTQQPTLWLLSGQEPARRWQRFVELFVAQAQGEGITGAVLMGSMLGDVPHTRPILVHGTSENETVRVDFDLERGRYEGPVGVLTVLAEALEKAGIATVNQWASIPHYLSMQAKSPKGVVALLESLQKFTGANLDLTELEAESRKWEASIDAATHDDADMLEYIHSLEQARDAWDTPAAKGDAIAREFEQFLRRDGRDGDAPRRPPHGPRDGV